MNKQNLLRKKIDHILDTVDKEDQREKILELFASLRSYVEFPTYKKVNKIKICDCMIDDNGEDECVVTLYVGHDVEVHHIKDSIFHHKGKKYKHYQMDAIGYKASNNWYKWID